MFDFYSLFDIFQQFSIRGSHFIVDCIILLLDMTLFHYYIYCIIVCITLNLFIIAQDLMFLQYCHFYYNLHELCSISRHLVVMNDVLSAGL